MKSPQFLQLHRIDDAVLASEATAGLLSRPAHASPKFFYDALGSRLFDAITELPEYYLTRTEEAIFAEHAAAIADAVLTRTGAHPVMIDLGAGNCVKAARLFERLSPRRYVAIDISVDFLRQSLQTLQRQHPALDMVGIGLDFSTRLQMPADVAAGPALLFYPGSSIGNFAPADALRLLRQARAAANGGALLIGVDLAKRPAPLRAAYDDELGVTAAFNLNLLRHLNRLIGADFKIRDWSHVALVNEPLSRVEMHLQARSDLQVRWCGGERRFAAGERMHTESSYKWRPAEFAALLGDAGFNEVQRWSDAQGWFGVFLAGG